MPIYLLFIPFLWRTLTNTEMTRQGILPCHRCVSGTEYLPTATCSSTFPSLLHIETGHVTSFAQWKVDTVAYVRTAPALVFSALSLHFGCLNGEDSVNASEEEPLDMQSLGPQTIPWKGIHEFGL